MSVFWLNDITILYTNDGWKQVIPTNDMSRIEQMNAISRLFIYLIIIFMLLDFPKSLLYIPIIGLILVILIFVFYGIDPNGRQKELIKNKEIVNHDTMGDLHKVTYDIESGKYDSDGKLQVGKEYTVYNRPNGNNLRYTTNELMDYDRNSCRRPTNDNPFMNPSVIDYNTDNAPLACDNSDEDVEREMSEKFEDGLNMDLTDLFATKNSQRMFYTIPTPSIPNDQIGFANWAYRTDSTCKEDQEKCLRYEDIKYTR